MIKLSLFLLSAGFFMPVLLSAQEEQLDTAMVNRIRQEEALNGQIPYIARRLTDVAGPRLTNSPGWHHAADWIVQTLREWGLVRAQKEAWGTYGYGWSAEKTTLALEKPYYSPLIAYAVPWSGSTHGPITAPAFIVPKMDSAWIAAHLSQMKGKILLVVTADTTTSQSFKPDAERYTDSALAAIGDTYMIGRKTVKTYRPYFLKMEQASDMLRNSSAVATLGAREGRDGTVFVQSIIGYRKKDQPMMPAMQVAKEDFLRVMRLVEEGQEPVLTLESNTKLYDQDLQGHNVIAEIQGTDPTLQSQVVMLGGHLDSWTAATGATDNGAGCIVALEAVRLLKTLGVKPKRTIRIALWDGEEEGLLGSFHYVKNHFGDPEDMKLKPGQQKVSVYFNLDNGSGKIRGIFAQGNEKAAAIFRQWFVPFRDMGASTVTLHNTGSTDHLSFDVVGIPGFQFIQDPLDYETRAHHSNEDNYDHLNLDDLRQAAVIEAAFVYFAAMRPEMMPRKPLGQPQKFLFDDLIP